MSTADLLKPTTSTERIVSMDVIRGVALLGILQWPQKALANVRQMTLTNYITHKIITTTIFIGFAKNWHFSARPTLLCFILHLNISVDLQPYLAKVLPLWSDKVGMEIYQLLEATACHESS